MNIQKIISGNFSTNLLKNKTLLKGLEKISEHGTSFSAGTSLLLSLTVRPTAIFSTPNVEKENKQYAVANSICSGLIKFLMVEAIALPIENAVKNIDKNPRKFLKRETIKTLKNGEKEFNSSRSYKLLTQMMKLGTGFFMAIPKSILTIALIPILMDKLFFKNSKNKTEILSPQKNEKINFTGNLTQKIAKHISAGTDILLTSTFAYQTTKRKKIKENRKKALIYNNIISTAVTLLGGYGIDNIIKKKTGKFIERFKQINALDPKLHKYIEGINILRPAIIFAGIYYGILPMFSTFTAEKVDKFIKKQNSKKQVPQ